MLYIDADHSYEGVKSDIALAEKKIKPDGLLVFNDYSMLKNYGVVHAVNEFIVRSDWKVIGFSLNVGMFSDIALRRC